VSKDNPVDLFADIVSIPSRIVLEKSNDNGPVIDGPSPVAGLWTWMNSPTRSSGSDSAAVWEG
jgi:hypothetical protein